MTPGDKQSGGLSMKNFLWFVASNPVESRLQYVVWLLLHRQSDALTQNLPPHPARLTPSCTSKVVCKGVPRRPLQPILL